MPALVEAVVARDLLLIRDLLADEVNSHLRYTSPGLIASCTMVWMMWSFIVISASTRGDAESVARCMLVDALALLQAA